MLGNAGESPGVAPLLSVIIETYTVSHEYPPNEALAQLGLTLNRLRGQTYPKQRTEIIVVVDDSNRGLADFVAANYPEVAITLARQGTYLSMKNQGFEVARGDIIALLDADCLPSPQWLERIAGALAGGADVVAGKTRYRPEHRFANTFSVFDFGHVQADRNGKTFSFNVNNLAFRREVVARNRFDQRVRRNGGCYLFWRKLGLANYDMIYDPRVFAGHGNDFSGLGIVRKHIERGFDFLTLLRISSPEQLDASRYKRWGALVPFGMFASRVLFDFRRMITNRRDLGIRIYELPYYYAVSLFIRGLELIGGLVAVFKPDHYSTMECAAS